MTDLGEACRLCAGQVRQAPALPGALVIRVTAEAVATGGPIFFESKSKNPCHNFYNTLVLRQFYASSPCRWRHSFEGLNDAGCKAGLPSHDCSRAHKTLCENRQVKYTNNLEVIKLGESGKSRGFCRSDKILYEVRVCDFRNEVIIGTAWCRCDQAVKTSFAKSWPAWLA